MKKQCENILLYLDKELSVPEKKEFEKHIESCEECKLFLESDGNNYQKISSIEPLSLSAKNELWESIESTLEIRVINTWQTSKKWLIAAAAALFILNGFNIYTFLQNRIQNSNETSIAYESNTEAWYEDSALDKMIYSIEENGGGNNE